MSILKICKELDIFLLATVLLTAPRSPDPSNFINMTFLVGATCTYMVISYLVEAKYHHATGRSAYAKATTNLKSFLHTFYGLISFIPPNLVNWSIKGEIYIPLPPIFFFLKKEICYLYEYEWK